MAGDKLRLGLSQERAQAPELRLTSKKADAWGGGSAIFGGRNRREHRHQRQHPQLQKHPASMRSSLGTCDLPESLIAGSERARKIREQKWVIASSSIPW